MGFNGSYKQGLAWTACHDPTVDEVFFGGGARMGKSIFLCAHEIIEATTWPETRGLIGRKEYTSLHDSTLKTWWETMAMFGYREGVEYKWNGADREVKWSNGSLTMFRHLKTEPGDPNYTRLGSTAFTRAAVDESDECEERLIDMLLLRTGYNPPPHGGKVIVTGNPGEYWTKHRYVYTKKNEPVTVGSAQRVILGTVADNPDPVVRAEYTRRLNAMRNEYDKARLLYGDWLVQPRNGMEFLPEFSSAEHVQRVPYDPSLALHITLDFNTSPYMTLLVCQIRQGDMGRWKVGFLKEYCPVHPFSTPRAAAQLFKEDLKTGCFAGHAAGVFIYGDSSGKNNKSGEAEAVTYDFAVVEEVLTRYIDGRSDRVLRSNPPHVKAREFMGHCFAGRLPIDITFDPDMHTTISDHVHLKQGPDGKIFKEYSVDPLTRIRSEKWGHCVQACYYLCIGAFPNEFHDMVEIAA